MTKGSRFRRASKSASSIAPGSSGRSAEEAIIAAVNHDGDSDSTGAIAGSLVGALYGPRAPPGRWLQALELRMVIQTLAADLAAVVERRADLAALEERYPGW